MKSDELMSHVFKESSHFSTVRNLSGAIRTLKNLDHVLLLNSSLLFNSTLISLKDSNYRLVLNQMNFAFTVFKLTQFIKYSGKMTKPCTTKPPPSPL